MRDGTFHEARGSQVHILLAEGRIYIDVCSCMVFGRQHYDQANGAGCNY